MAGFLTRHVKWGVVALLGRNPLVRTCDRVEAATLTLAALLIVLALPGGAAIGVTVYHDGARTYSTETQTRHELLATTTEDGHPTVPGKPSASTVHARWQFHGVDHVDAVVTDATLKAGAPLHIWVDDAGNRVDEPTPLSAAEMDGLITGIVTWFIVTLFTCLAAATATVHLAIVRDLGWDSDLRSLVDDDGGRTSAT